MAMEQIQNGLSAYEFRKEINKAINEYNASTADIQNKYNEILEVDKRVTAAESGAIASINSAVAETTNAAKKEINDEKDKAKNEINAMVPEIGGGLSDIAKIKLQANQPQRDAEGYLPNFWYKII